jgi:hypothetical protein
MFDFLGPEWAKPVNYLFLVVTAIIAVHAIRWRDAEGKPDFVRLLFGSIAAVFFLLVLFQDVLHIVRFS